MATLSSHTLDGTNGTHAAGVGVSLVRINADGTREEIFAAETDEGGRLVQEIAAERIDTEAIHELVFDTSGYWRKQGASNSTSTPVTEVVVRLTLPCTESRYHVPIILAPNAYSFWSSERPKPGQ